MTAAGAPSPQPSETTTWEIALRQAGFIPAEEGLLLDTSPPAMALEAEN